MAAIGVTILLTAGVAGYSVALHRILTQSAEDAASVLSAQTAETLATGEHTPTEAVRTLPAQRSFLQVIDDSGKVIAASNPQVATSPITSARPAVDTQVVTQLSHLGGDEDPFVVVARGVQTPTGQKLVVLVASPLDVETRTIATATTMLAVAAVLLAIILLAAIVRVVSSALNPVARLTTEVGAISGAGGSDRVTVPPAGDEITMLALTMNDMLDRLSRSDAAMRRFISDASHELRSPLATLRTHIETAPDVDGERAAVDRELTVTEVDRIYRLVSDLLTLAKADDQGLALQSVEVDLDDVVDAEVHRLRSIATGAVRASLAPAQVNGDPERLAQLLRNLTDNALRHTRGWVAVLMDDDEPGWIKVHVDNAGPPLPDASREAVFGRFARLDEARARDSGGSGLGLAIACTFARAHGGSITAGQTPDGDCRFTVRLPLMPQ